MRSLHLLFTVLSISCLITLINCGPILTKSSKVKNVKETSDLKLRLPKTSKPIAYEVNLKTAVHRGSRPFEGNVTIKLVIVEATDTLVIHSKRLQINDLVLIDSSDKEIALTYTVLPNKDFINIEIVRRILNPNEQYTLMISYTGSLNTGTSGFYRSSYQLDGVTRYLAVTQFESTDARAAFPSYDEPEFKATFKVSLVHDPTYNAISNTDGTTTSNADGTVTTTFATTPVMSSYLLAFMVSDFASKSNVDTKSANETLHRIHMRPDAINRSDLGLIYSAVLLQQLEDFVKVKYELPSMNSAAIPDFAAGAMENWGFITYTEEYLIGDSKSSHKEIINILGTIAHELGHQFFGNLVTCQWWEFIWLNEGFATVFEYLLLEKEYPDMRWKDLFNVQSLRRAFRSDSTEATRPMTTGAQTPSEISDLFDDIAYSKSGSVIRMFQYAVGENLFRDALNSYLMTNNHMPVTPKNLYTAFQTTMDARNFKDFDFETAFKTWELQKGYPMIHVKYADNNFQITQKRYLTDRNDGGTPNSSWYIPLNYATTGTPNFDDTTISHYFKDTEAMKMIPVTMAPNQWFVFNKQGLGYYRVNYDFENWHEIIKTLNSPNFNSINILNRAQILDDSITFAFDGNLDYDVALGLMQYLNRETDYIPWATVLPMINNLDMKLGLSPLHTQYQKFILSLVVRMYAKYGMEEFADETLIDKHARETAINLACKMGHSGCLYNAFVALHLETHQKIEIPASLQTVLYCHGLRNTQTQTEFVYLYKKLQASTDHAERNRLIDGLTCSEDPQTLKDLLETTIGNTEVNYRSEDRTRIINRVYSRSTIGKTAVIEFVSKFYAELNSYGQDVDDILIGVSKRIVMHEDQIKITVAMDGLVDKLKPTTRTEVLFNVDNNKMWLADTNYANIGNYVDRELKRQEKELNLLRLPKTTVPISYKVNLKTTDLHTGSLLYDGEVSIKIAVKEVTDRIMLHSKDQTITELHVFEADNITPVKLIEYILYAPADTLTVHLMNNVMPGSEYILHIKFSTQLRTSGSGFYQTSYVMNGTTRYLGATQFQATGARFAFPCYDEPSFKATFEIDIKHDASFNAIANTEAVRTTNGDGTVTTSFEPSPVMSSYLVAFVISDFEFISNALTKGTNDTLHRIYSRPNAVKLTPFALDNSEKLLQVLERYVDYKFELPKIDSAAIPQKSGAMENWGLVLYSENLMIYEENYNDISHTQRLGGVATIAHELSHQFFGNLLTCDWWSSIWLNEGFATVFEYALVDTVYPDWNMKAFFNLRQVQRAYRSDALQSTRAMTTELNTIAEISQSFDNIAYSKAGSVIRMFQYAVGETIFREALNLYLKTNNHMPVTPTALHTAFQTTMDSRNFKDFDFPTAFKTWELQKGFPIIHVKYADNNFHITQKRYMTETNMTDNSKWYIPLNYATTGTPNFEDTTISHYFKDTEAMKMIPVTMAPNQWFIFNKQGLGYYRVNYDFENWHEIIKTLNSPNFNSINILNRAQILDDALSFASIGLVDYEVALGLMQYLSRETDYVPWGTVDIFLNSLITTFGGFDTYINQFIGMLSKELYDSFEIIDNKIPYEPLTKRHGREMAFKWACRGGNQKCLNDTSSQVHLVVHHDWIVPKGLESVIYCSGLRGGDKRGEWVNMWVMMQESNDSGDRSRFIAGLGCVEDLELLGDYLETTLSTNNDNNYSVNERLAVFNSVLSSSVGVEAILKFLTKYELEIVMIYRTTLNSLLSNVARTVKTQQQLALFITYLSDNDSLDIQIFRSVTNIAGNNLKLQQSQQFAPVMTIIKQYVDKINDVTEVPSTTVVMETSTVTATSTTPVTETVTITATEASTTTSQAPTVSTSTQASTTVTVPSTTQGAASLSFKFITLLTCITAAVFLK